MSFIKIRMTPMMVVDEDSKYKPEKLDDGVWGILGKVKIFGDDDEKKEEERYIYLLFDPKKFEKPGDVAKWIADNKPEDAEKEDWHVSIEQVERAFNELELDKLVKDLAGKEI